MVTRTFTSTKVKVMVVNNETSEISTVERILPKTYADSEAMLKALEKGCPYEGHKYFHILEAETELKRYGMEDTKFIENGEELPLLKAGEVDEIND